MTAQPAQNEKPVVRITLESLRNVEDLDDFLAAVHHLGVPAFSTASLDLNGQLHVRCFLNQVDLQPLLRWAEDGGLDQHDAKDQPAEAAEAGKS